MSKSKGAFVLLMIILAMSTLLIGGIKYQSTYTKTEIMRAKSDDGQYTLFV